MNVRTTMPKTDYDKYVDEIREIRRRHAEETRDELLEKRAKKVKKESEEFQKLIEKNAAANPVTVVKSEPSIVKGRAVTP